MRKVYIANISERKDQFWDNHWSRCNLEEIVNDVEASPMLPIFLKYFPKGEKILEGGCGLGKYVAYFAMRGYDIEGIDFANETIKRIKKHNPKLQVKNGDLKKLECGDGYYSVYYSGGTIEHYEEGISSIIKEAYRVLKKTGLLIVTVPYVSMLKSAKDYIYFNILKRKKQFFRLLDGTPGYYFLTKECQLNHDSEKEWKFYSYVYKKKEIEKKLSELGFSPFFSKRMQVKWGIRKLLSNKYPVGYNKKRGPVVNFLNKYLFCESEESIISKIFIRILGLFFAHQILYICKKNEY